MHRGLNDSRAPGARGAQNLAAGIQAGHRWSGYMANPPGGGPTITSDVACTAGSCCQGSHSRHVCDWTGSLPLRVVSICCARLIWAARAAACIHLSSVWQHTMLTAADCANNDVHGTQLLRHGELAPGLTTEEFAMRRQRLAEALPPDSVAILPAPPPKHMAGAVPFPYRPVSRPVLHFLAPPD